MANGHTEIDPDELHRTGCEYGRSLGKDVGYLRDDVSEMKADIKELRESTKRIEQSLAKSEWLRTLGMAGVSAIIAAIVARWNGILQRVIVPYANIHRL